MPNLTPEDRQRLEEIAARAKKATAPPWEFQTGCSWRFGTEDGSTSAVTSGGSPMADLANATWVRTGEDEWVFGVSVRGVVREELANVYFDEDRYEEGGWIWLLIGQEPRGQEVYFVAAVEAAEKALGVQ